MKASTDSPQSIPLVDNRPRRSRTRPTLRPDSIAPNPTSTAKMSSAAPTDPTDKGKAKDKKGVGKFLSRVKTVLKRGEGSKRQSVAAPKAETKR